MKDLKLRTGEAYNQSGSIYDDVLTARKWWSKLYINLFWGVDDFTIAATVLDLIPDTFCGRLLDVPVGTGVFTADKYQKMTYAEILALDYSTEMLAQAAERFERAGIKHISCIQGDVGDLPFGSESMDIVLTMNGLHVFTDKYKALSEMARVLKKGGRLIGSTYIKGEYAPTDFAVNLVLAKKGWFNPPFYTKEELQDALENDYWSVTVHAEKGIALFNCTK